MTEVYAMITDGTEEVECLAVVDILRRAEIETKLVSASDSKEVTSSHGVRITADATLADIAPDEAKSIFVPGGMPGSKKLGACKPLIDMIRRTLGSGGRVAAICAAPATVLGANGLLVGKKAICFPGMEQGMTGAKVQQGARVVTDGNITTARGLGCAIELGLELVRLLRGEAQADAIKSKIQF